MHDIRLIRDDPAAFDAAMARRGLEPQASFILELDAQFRKIQTTFETIRADQRKLGEEIAKYRRDLAKRRAEVEHINNERDRNRELNAIRSNEHDVARREKAALALKKQIAESESAGSAAKQYLSDLLASLPNYPADSVPDGENESANIELKTWGDKRAFNYPPANHADLGPVLGLDFETAAALSGARFAFLRGQMARLQRALGQFMLDRQTANGFVECAPPLLVRDEAMFGTGQLPKFAEDSFRTGDGRWLIPTSEVSLTNSVREQILSADALPIRLTALTPCFRSEAGAAGKDTRGYIRQHQFEKVELVTICRPEDSEAEHEKMTLAAESVLEALDLPYRRMLLCAGDMGFSARKTYDLEVWLPGQDAYREISSVSNCGDFQARRMNARFRPEGQKGTEFVHTLNGSGLAVGRALVAVLENCQQEDGSVHLPAALHPYMGGVTRLEPTK